MLDSVRAILLFAWAPMVAWLLVLGLRLGLPAWILFSGSVAAVLGMMYLLYAPGELRRDRREKGLCERCGYDLRATPGRCPECGANPGVK